MAQNSTPPEALRHDDGFWVSMAMLMVAVVCAGGLAFVIAKGIWTMENVAWLTGGAVVGASVFIARVRSSEQAERVHLDESQRRFVLTHGRGSRRRVDILSFDDIASIDIEVETKRENDGYGDIEMRTFTLAARTPHGQRHVLATPVTTKYFDSAEEKLLVELRNRLAALVAAPFAAAPSCLERGNG